MVYGSRANGNEHGVVLTKAEVVVKMLDMVDYRAELDLSAVKVIEPAVGEGAFALPIIERLHSSSKRYSFDFESALSNLQFYDIDEASLEILSQRIEERFNEISKEAIRAMLHCGDFLLTNARRCNLIIGNPPYVRHEKIPEEKRKAYRAQFQTFTHRSDLYIPFYEKGLKLLIDGGSLSYICANRWLKNQYGQKLRSLISSSFQLREVIDLENVDAFEESVIAYPAITTIVNVRSKSPTPYFELDSLDSLLSFDIETAADRFLSINSTNWFSREYNYNDESLELASIAEQGFKIGIGVATGRDRVFIRKDFKELVEEELLIPMLTSKGVRGDRIEWKGDYFINPYSSGGKLIDLDHFPKAKAYFLENYETLSNRHVSKKNPFNWYRTIDRVQVSLTFSPKIILPDITGNPLIHIDKGQYYPHHNLYYITGKPIEDLELLAAILMSDFVRDQLNELGNKMNGGYPRWQSQNIRKLKVPFLDSIPPDKGRAIRKAYRAKDLAAINGLVNVAEFSGFERTQGQLALFDPDLTSLYSSNQDS